MPRDDDPAALALLTVRDVARLLRTHPRTVWRLAAARTIPQPIRLGPKLVRWRAQDLAKVLQGAGAQ